MAKPSLTDSEQFDRTSLLSTILPPPADFDMNWPEALSQSESSIQSQQQQQQQQQPFLNRSTNTACQSSSYKISIGHETVNITEMTPHRQSAISSDPTLATASSMGSNERRRLLNTRKGANVVSLCFMCFVSSSLILIAISTMHLLLKTDSLHRNDLLPYLLQPSNDTAQLLSLLAVPISLTDQILPTYDRTIRDLATVVCLSIIVLNCFCLLVFSIEIYLGCNMVKGKQDLYRCRFLFSSSSSGFIAICGFYASIPGLILVMCLFILLHMSLVPAIIALAVLGAGLVFILMTLLTYFVTWQKMQLPLKRGKSTVSPAELLRSIEDEIDLTKADELSTLV